MCQDKLYDALRGRKYVYLVSTGHSTSNANILACNKAQAENIAKTKWFESIVQCDEVTESFRNLNNSLSDKDMEQLEPGVLRINFPGNGHTWHTE